MNPISKLLLIRKLRRDLYRMTPAALRAHQERLTRESVRNAYQRSPYYRELYADHDLHDFEALPLTDKASMMEHFSRFNTAGLDRDALLAFATAHESSASGEALYQGRWSVGLSSGTSGNKGLTVLSPDERARYGCLVAARHGLPRSVRAFRVLFALRINSPAFEQMNSFGMKLVYTDYNNPIEAVVGVINRERLNVLAGPPSFLSLIGTRVNDLERRVDALVCYAEVLTPEARAALERTYGAPVVEIYQGSEGFLGATCREGRLHLMEDLIRAEIFPVAEGGPGRVVITDLHRRTQPIIRYQLNDLLELGPADCTCGSAFLTIARVHGRVDDLFYFDDAAGERRYLFPDYVRRAIILASDAVQEYQAIQHAPDDVELRLVLDRAAERAPIEDQVRANLHARLRDAGVPEAIWPALRFTWQAPEKNPRSGKLVRIQRRF